MTFPLSRSAVIILIWLALLLALPAAAYSLSGETEVVIGDQGGAVWADVHGTRMDVPAEVLASTDAGRLKLPDLSQLTIAPPSSSQYWQGAQSDIAPAIGVVGEWLQMVRPPSQWISAQTTPTGTIAYRLKAGRALFMLPLDDGTGHGFVLQLRPERAAMAWWTMENGAPVKQVAGTGYRPSGRLSVGDLLAEVSLIGWAATLLCLLSLPVGLALAALGRRFFWGGSEPAPGVAAPKRRGLPLLSQIPSRVYPALALFVGGTVLASAICLAVLDGIPHVQDDVAYLFQGKIFALLHFWVPEPPAPEFFESGFIMRLDGRWFSKYPPGYPLLLVPTLWAGVPWLTNALSSGASLALVYLSGLRMFGLQTATWAGLLGLVSPWVLFMSGSYMSHPTTMFWAALFLYALVGMRLARELPSLLGHGQGAAQPGRSAVGLSTLLFRLSPRNWPSQAWALLAGFAIGMALISREWTALGIGLGAALWGLWDLLSSRPRGRKLVSYALVLVGFLPPLLFLLYENSVLTGEWLRFPQDLVGSYDTPGFGPGHGTPEGHTPALGVYNALVYLRTLATVFNGWPAPFALAPILLGLFAWLRLRPQTENSPLRRQDSRARRRVTASRFTFHVSRFAGLSAHGLAWDALLWLPLAGLIVAYFFWWSGTTIYGPRYWYEGMPFMLLMAGRGMDVLGRIAASTLEGKLARRIRWALPAAIFGLFTIYSLTQTLPAQAHFYTDYNDISSEAVQQVAEAHLKNAVVFVALEKSRPDRDYGKVFFANDPLLQGEVVYARDLGPANNAYLVSRLPGRVPYYLPLAGPPKPGVGP